MSSPSSSSQEFKLVDPPSQRLSWPSLRRVKRFVRKNWIGTSMLVGVVAIAFLPYEFRPGGSLEVLPLNQQRLQAMVTGRLDRVFVSGGDGKTIKAGDIVATIQAPDQENEYRKTKEDIQKQQATVEQAEANLNKLLNIPRPEDIQVARQQVEVARQQVEVARQQVVAVHQQVQTAQQQVEVARNDQKTAISLSNASLAKAKRYTELYQSGAFSQQQAEDVQRQADAEQDDVESKKATIALQEANVVTQRANEATQNSEALKRQQELQQAEANLNLVLAGAHPDDVQAARDQVRVSRAEAQRLVQQLKYLGDQLRRTQVRMPFDGHLVDNKLSDKVGTYLSQGDTFAVAEVGRSKMLFAKVQVAEEMADQLFPHRKVTAKLQAFPNDPIYGRVVSIQPAATKQKSKETKADISGSSSTDSQENIGRVVEVIVELPNSDSRLHSGMTGYAKIEGTTMPLAVAFSRSLIRFFQIEVWSWLP
jgi:putative peptide zinc metalloprotease protein